MPVTDEEIETVARIAQLHSPDSSAHPWAGRSLADLLTLTEYHRIRPELREAQLAEWLASRPEFSEHWLRWSEDKRTSGGYYIGRIAEGWRIGSVSSEAIWDYSTESDAVAAYILRELDYWATQPGERS